MYVCMYIIFALRDEFVLEFLRAPVDTRSVFAANFCFDITHG